MNIQRPMLEGDGFLTFYLILLSSVRMRNPPLGSAWYTYENIWLNLVALLFQCNALLKKYL